MVSIKYVMRVFSQKCKVVLNRVTNKLRAVYRDSSSLFLMFLKRTNEHNVLSENGFFYMENYGGWPE